MADSKLYKLTIIDTSGNLTWVLGPEKELRPIYESWRDSTFDDTKKVVASGICDDAGRSRVEVAMEKESVRGMTLEEYY